MGELMNTVVLPVAGALVLILLAILAFFVSRLIEKVDKIGETLPTYTTKVDVMSAQLSEVKADVQRIAVDFKEVSELRERVAVLEYASKKRRNDPR